MTERFEITQNTKIVPIKPLNDELTLCKCYVMGLGKNNNKLHIGQAAADDAQPTIYNIPVIGNLYQTEDGEYHMGGHDMTLEVSPDGMLRFKSLCVPYGVVPQQDNIHYEDVVEPNGTVRRMVVADIILWTGRYPELLEAAYDENTYFSQSMEINVLGKQIMDDDKNYTDVTDYTYSALCLLGRSNSPEYNVNPCFPMARVEPYEFSLVDENFAKLMSQLKNELTMCFAGKGEKGVNENETIIEQPVAEQPVVTEDTTSVEPQEPAAEPAEPVAEPEATPVQEMFADNQHQEPEVALFMSTYRERCEAISEAMPRSEDVCYWVCDFDDNFAYVERTVRFEDHCDYSKGRMAYTYDEDTHTATVTGDFEEMFIKWLTADEIKALDNLRDEHAALSAYKAEREVADHRNAIDRAVTEFEDLSGNEMYDAIFSNRYSYQTVEELQNACYIVRGKFSAPKSKTPAHTEPIIPVVTDETHEETLIERFHAHFSKKQYR